MSGFLEKFQTKTNRSDLDAALRCCESARAQLEQVESHLRRSAEALEQLSAEGVAGSGEALRLAHAHYCSVVTIVNRGQAEIDRAATHLDECLMLSRTELAQRELNVLCSQVEEQKKDARRLRELCGRVSHESGMLAEQASLIFASAFAEYQSGTRYCVWGKLKSIDVEADISDCRSVGDRYFAEAKALFQNAVALFVGNGGVWPLPEKVS